MNATVEVIDKDKKPILFDAAYLWIAHEQTHRELDKKTTLSKDIFKLDEPYNEQFWKNQNNLLLTEEMKSFINNLGDSDQEFKIRANMEPKQ